MLFAYFTMQQYFFRSNHRQRFNSVQFGKVCPGGVYCGELLHWTLLIYELIAPFVLGLLLLPLITGARIRYAYQGTVTREAQRKKIEGDFELKSP
jgi:hypothetical protein